MLHVEIKVLDIKVYAFLLVLINFDAATHKMFIYQMF